MFDEMMAYGLVILLLAVWHLIRRLQALHVILIAPLPSAVTSQGKVPLTPENQAQYFMSMRNKFSKGSRRWQQYDTKLKAVSGGN